MVSEAPRTMPYGVTLARAVERIPLPSALPGGARYEPKWDGHRSMTMNTLDGPRIWSRHGTDMTGTFPEISAAVADQVDPGTVLDGEIVVWQDGRLAFEVLQRRLGRGARSAAAAARSTPASLAVFDILADRGVDVRSETYDQRRALLEARAEGWRPPLNLSPVTSDLEVATEWFETYVAAGIEGLVVKGGAQPYGRGGERLWQKVKHRATVDAVCGAVTGSLQRPAEIIVGLPFDGVLRVAGRSTPLSSAARRALAPLLRTPVGQHPWASTISAGTLGRWGGRSAPVEIVRVEPFVVEVSADVAWSGRSWRHPLRFVRARPDLEVEDVVAPA